MKIPANLQPRSLVAVAITVGALMIGSALYELHQSRSELFHVMEEEAVSLSESISRGSENILRSQDLLEQLVYQRLFTAARAVALADSAAPLSHTALRSFTASFSVFRVNVISRSGARILSSHTPDPAHQRPEHGEVRLAALQPLLSGAADSLVLGLREGQMDDELRYAVAVRRLRPEGGAIVVNLDAREFLAFRRSVGIGRLITDLGDNSGIEYVVLQDDEGILSASRTVEEMSSIASDPLLELATASDTVITRTTAFGGREVYEVIRPLRLDGEFVGLIRIGLSMEEIRASEGRMQRRMVITTIVLVFIGILAVSAIMAVENFRLLARRHTSFRSMTSNILEQMQDAVVSVDAADRVVLFNAQAERLFEVDAAGVVGQRLQELREDLPCLTHVFSHGSGDVTLSCGASPRDLSISLSTIRSADGTVESRTAVLRDLTERKKIERALQQKERLTALGELASGVAHEIRNPINAISMIAQRLRNEFTPRTDEDEYRQLTDVVRTQVARVNRIVQQFLRFARPAPPAIAPVPVAVLLETADATFRSQALARQVNFRTEANCNKTAHVDRDQLMQALLNLLQNALDATPQGGSITLGASCSGDTLLLTVQDTGAGIPAETLDRIFDLYYTTKPEGTGMGLAITQQIITQHGGTISVQSTSGHGSTFTVTLPGVLSA
jgi:signal transduction histidine kinase